MSARNDAELGISQYVYDGESQLLGVANGAGSWRKTFAYDGAGNRIATSGQSVVVDAGNRLLCQGEVVCKYDRRGNVVRISDSRATWRFKYDLKNQMTHAEGPDGVIEFKYDAIGRRIEKKSSTRTIRYAWCGEGLTRETITTKDGESIREYLYRPASYEPLAVRIDGRCYFYHNDHQGTPQRITDDQGKVVWSADYFAFGYAQVKVALIENPLRFAGQYADSETGLHYNRFRYYSPVLGRYLSIDPLRLIPGNNLYLYVRNNPINKLDGLGLWSVMGIVGAVAVAAAVVVAAPFLLAAAPLIVAGGLLVAEAISVGRDFCIRCFLQGAGEAFLPGVVIGAVFAAGLAVVAAVVSAPVAAVVGVAVGLYFAYEMLDQHFGWSGGTPFEDLSPDEKSRSMGRLFGGTVGALLGGLGVGRLIGGPKGGVPIEEGAGKAKGKGAAEAEAPPGESKGGLEEAPVEERPIEEEPVEEQPIEEEPARPRTPKERVDALKNNPKVTDSPTNSESKSQLDLIEERAQDPDPQVSEGALGELDAIERHTAEGSEVRVRPESQIQNQTSPDLDVNGKKTEVKTRTEPLDNRAVSRLVDDANKQVKNSGESGPGQADIQLKKAGAENVPDNAELNRQVRKNFNENRGRSLDKVTVLNEGQKIGEWVRDPATGKVTQTFPPPGTPPNPAPEDP